MQTLKQKILLFLFVLISFFAAAQNNCCSNTSCKDKAEQLKETILPLMEFVGKAERDNAERNEEILKAAHQRDAAKYNNFKNAMYELINFTLDIDRNNCFKSLLTNQEFVDVNQWRVYFNDLVNEVTFPSPQFCAGIRTRAEINQGAANFLRKDMAYLGSVSYYLAYTFGKKDKCGNKLRMLAGPSLFLQNRTPYVALSSKIAYRLKDIGIKNPPVSLGNLNLFGQYSTNFNRFHFAGLGIEAQLGRFGVSATALHHFRSKHQGFLIGLFIGNRKK